MNQARFAKAARSELLAQTAYYEPLRKAHDEGSLPIAAAADRLDQGHAVVVLGVGLQERGCDLVGRLQDLPGIAVVDLQDGGAAHGYDSYGYLPLYVFCGQQLLCAYLRPSDIDGARHAAAILKRRVITRLEWGDQGCNPRFIVTNLTDEPQTLYDDVYCARGEAENRIKEAQIGLFATRTSCHVLRSNQLRMLLAALTLNDKAAPGRRDDTRTARNPSRGRGEYEYTAPARDQHLVCSHCHALGALTAGPEPLDGERPGVCAKYPG